jgi:hypothetical protein
MGNFLLTSREVRLTGAAEAGPSRPADDRYKWVALSNTTAAVLMATMNGSIVLTANSAAILTDAFPVNQRGFALGINQVASLAGGIALLGVFTLIESRVAEPMFRLPLHGYDYSVTPLWAGIFPLPLTAGILTGGPLSGFLSDRFGARGFATAGMGVFAGSFIGLMLLPVNFPYWAFALLIAANGIGSGLFGSPNSSSIMSSVPARDRGAASGMRSTFANTGTALSIGVFTSLMIAGLASTLPATLSGGLRSHGVPAAAAQHIGSLPPVSSLFAALLGGTRSVTCWPRATGSAGCPPVPARSSPAGSSSPS